MHVGPIANHAFVHLDLAALVNTHASQAVQITVLMQKSANQGNFVWSIRMGVRVRLDFKAWSVQTVG